MTTLTIPTEGPCRGHPCDNCKTCQSGRCCRKDNPDYKLPGLGEWDGPVYGELGVLNDDGEKVECHCCGEWYQQLTKHVEAAHDLTTREYKSIFGLRLKSGLVSTAVHQRRSQSALYNVEHNPNMHLLTGEMINQTPEQISEFHRKRRRTPFEKERQRATVIARNKARGKQAQV